MSLEENVNIDISNFEGPIDLLYSLIKDKQMDIMQVNLEELAISYISVIDKIKDKNIDLASEYLVMAATLLQIKARALINNPDENQKIEVTKEEILKRLVEHQKFKNIAKILRDKEFNRKKIFIKDQENIKYFQDEIVESKLDGKSNAVKLIISLRKMFERTYAQKLRETIIEPFNLSPAIRRKEIIDIFKQKNQVNFEDIFSVPTMNHFVVTLVTVLDMAVKQEVIINQDSQFGNITIKKGAINELQ